MTQQLLKNAKEIYSRNKDTEGNKFPSNQIFKFINLQKNNKSIISKNNNNNINNKNNINNNNDNYNYYNNNDYNNNDYNDNHIFENQNNSNIIKITNNNISHPKTLTIKMTKEIMNEIYNSKSSYDKKCYENKLPRETMEQHMYTYLNQKYGLKNLIIEWASSIINAIKKYSSIDNDINLFGKILRNEQEEDSRLILIKLRTTISDLLEYYLKTKNPLKNQNEIKTMLNYIKENNLNEEEWKGIIYYIYNLNDAKNLENKITDYIYYLRNNENYNEYSNSNLNNNNIYSNYNSKNKNLKLTREQIFNLNKIKDDLSIPYKDFLKLVGEHQIKSREIYLKNFVQLFRTFDNDSDGILNEEEFINLIKSINFLQNNVDDYIFKFLSIIDPFNNKKITFSECVSLFSLEIINDNENNQISLLDKICLFD